MANNPHSIKFQAMEKFGYDVTAIPDFTDDNMPNVITDLIENSKFLSQLSMIENIKGTKQILLANGDITLQAIEGCTLTPDGAFVFTDEDITVYPLGAAIEFCNEDLNGKITQLFNSPGMRGQNDHLPTELDGLIMTYLMRVLQKKAQRLLILGDEGSVNPELALLNGIRYRINNDVTVIDYMSAETSITASNAYTIAVGLYESIPVELFDNGMDVVIYTGRTEAMAILKQWNNANPYDRVAMPTDNTTSLEFNLPMYPIRVISLPELNGLGEMYAWANDLVFVGTDQKSDWVFDMKYDDYNDKLKAEAKFRLGTQIVWGKYFTRLQLAAS